MRITGCLCLNLLCLLLWISPGHAGHAGHAGEPQHILFADYAYGMPKAHIAALPDVVAPEDAESRDLFLPKTEYAGMNWQLRFEFVNEQLVRTSLMAPWSKERMDAVVSRLRNDKYEALALLVDDKSLDFISLIKIEGPQALNAKVASLLENDTHRRVTYAWFVTEGISKEIKMRARNLTELMMIVSSETREAELTQVRGETGQAVLLVDFTFPVLDAMRNRPAR